MKVKSESEVTQSCSNPQRPRGLQPSRLLHPWDFPGKSAGVGCHCLLHLERWRFCYRTPWLCLRCLEGWLDEWISKGAKKLSHRTFLLVYFYYLVLWFWYGQEESCSHISEFCRGLNLPLEKVMASHSSTLAWKISWTEKPGRLQSMGSRRVRHD